MSEVAPIFLLCIAVGIVTSGLLHSGLAVVMNSQPQRKTALFSWNIVNLLYFIATGALGMYARALHHGAAIQRQPVQGLLAVLAVAVGGMWSFLLGVAVLNVYVHI